MKPAILPLLVLLTGLLAFVLVLAGADTARAGTFNPTLKVTVGNPEPEASSDFTNEFGIPPGDVNFGPVVGFIPKDWGIVTGDNIPIGTQVGTVNAVATLGLINAACNTALDVSFDMLNGSLDPSDTVSFLDADDNTIQDFAEDKDGNEVPDAVDKFPDFIQRIVPDLVPIRRAAGVTSVAGVNVLLQFLIYEPGSVISAGIDSDPELGFPSVTFLQNIGDPEAVPAPSPITDFCSPLESVIKSLGTSEDGTAVSVNPKDGTYTFTTIAFGQRDADGDGIQNSMDTCPFVANAGDSTVQGDGDTDTDGLDAACDPDDNQSRFDQDDDGYPNRGDNCPLIANGEDGTNQADDDIDQIGNECDTEGNGPDTADGEYAQARLTADVAIGTGQGEGGPPDCPECFSVGGGGGGDGDGGLGTGALIGIIVGVVAAVVVVGGGAAYAMRRRA